MGKGKQIYRVVFFTLLSTAVYAQTSTITVTEISASKTSLSQQTSSNTKYKAAIESMFWGRHLEDRFFKQNAAHVDIIPKFTSRYNSWLAVDLQLEGYFVAGNSDNFYSDEGKSSNGIYLVEAAATFTPFEGLDLRAGALNLPLNPLLSIMSENTFFGALQKYEAKMADGDIIASVTAVEAVPSAGSVNRGMIAENAPNAFFLSQTAQLEAKIHPIKSTIKAAATHFEFGNLGPNVASDSILIGNNPRSFEGLGTQTRYVIGFRGVEAAASLITDLSARFSTDLTAHMIQNFEAVEGASGVQGMVKLVTKFNGFNISPSATLFRMGADVTPATYSSIARRQHNREGLTAKVELEMPAEKLKFFGSYTRGEVILANPYMADRDTFNVGVEAKYDIL